MFSLLEVGVGVEYRLAFVMSWDLMLWLSLKVSLFVPQSEDLWEPVPDLLSRLLTLGY